MTDSNNLKSKGSWFSLKSFLLWLISAIVLWRLSFVTPDMASVFFSNTIPMFLLDFAGDPYSRAAGNPLYYFLSYFLIISMFYGTISWLVIIFVKISWKISRGNWNIPSGLISDLFGVMFIWAFPFLVLTFLSMSYSLILREEFDRDVARLASTNSPDVIRDIQSEWSRIKNYQDFKVVTQKIKSLK